jgi:hypothetical protein
MLILGNLKTLHYKKCKFILIINGKMENKQNLQILDSII